MVAAAEAGEDDVAVLRARLVDLVAGEEEAALDYAEVVDASTLEPAVDLAGPRRVLVAAHFGRTRLLDNMGISAPGV